MALSQEEINKIHEEEAERAKAQQLYAAKHPQTVVVKKKTSKLAMGCGTLFFLFIVLPIIIVTVRNASPEQRAQDQAHQAADAERMQQTLTELGRVEVLSSTIEFDSIGTPELVVKLKNNAGQAVDAVTVESYFLNNYDEPIGQWNSKSREAYRGIIQDRIASGATYTATFNLAVYDLATKVDSTTVVKVHYEDGSSYAL
ncbi:MAG: hypothetical protein WCV88_05720 [Patescibacteria group bacterium]